MTFMRRVLILISILILTGCDQRANQVSAIGLPSPTPFQPGINGSDSLYADSPPTPLFPLTATLSPAPPEPTLIPTAIAATAVTLPIPLDPLTGLPASDPALLERHPLAIKVANYPRYIRPQSGLTLADQVFEYYIEGGLTRFVAIMYGNDSQWVGPVRSGRFFDENVQRMYQAFLVFKYADKRVLDYFKTTDFADYLVVPSLGQTSFGPCPPFFLLDERKIEVYNNSYFNTTLWQPCVDKYDLPNGPPSFQPGLFAADNIPRSDLPADLIHTYYSDDDYNYWQYNTDIGEYLRFQEVKDTRDGREEAYAPLVDRMTGEQVHAANVIVIFAYHTFANPFNEEDEVYSIDLTGSGEAYVFRDGVGVVAKWHRLYQNQPLTFTDSIGAQIYLKPGITFYEVIGSNSYADQGDGEWDFHHFTP